MNKKEIQALSSVDLIYAHYAASLTLSYHNTQASIRELRYIEEELCHRLNADYSELEKRGG